MKDISNMESLTAATSDEILTGKKAKTEDSQQLSSSLMFYDVGTPTAELTSDNRNFIEKIIDAYQNAPIKPFIMRKDIGGNDTGFADDGGGKKSALIIGLEFKF